MEHHQLDGAYPDMNYIFFKGVPKMIQVADDMHRMTDYIMDLRNMTVALVCLSVLGALLFLVLRYVQKRNGSMKRQRPMTHRFEALENGKEWIHSNCGTYRGFPDPWNDVTVKAPAIIMDKVRFNSSSPPTVTTDGSVEETPRFANGVTNTNKTQVFKEKAPSDHQTGR